MPEPAFRILVVEDEELLRNLIETALKTRGYKVELAGDGAQALRKIGESHYDLVVTDFKMPHMTGAQLIRALRRRPGRIPIVLMSSHTPRELEIPPEELAGIEYLRKPFGLTELYGAVQRAVSPGGPPP